MYVDLEIFLQYILDFFLKKFEKILFQLDFNFFWKFCLKNTYNYFLAKILFNLWERECYGPGGNLEGRTSINTIIL